MVQLKSFLFVGFWLASLPVLAQHGLEQLPEELVASYESLAAEVRGDAETLARVIEAGRERAVFCNTCHGPDGSAQRANYPSLAAQNPVYLLDQIEQFADGSREKLVMNVLAETFSVEEKVTLALYYAQMKLEPTDFDEALARRGAQVYQLRCAQCHGAGGLGEAGYARIAGQQPEYVAEVLREYRGGDSPRRLSVMYGIAAGLSESDIQAVAHYAASLQRQ
jgi:cytochrome c553